MILSICEDPKVLEITRLINIFVEIIRIVVPIVLIFVLMFKLIGAIMSDNVNGLKKVLRIAPKNMIAAAIVFLVPTIVRLAVRFTSGDTSYENCLMVVSTSEINAAYENKMEELMVRAEETLDIDNYSVAYKYLRNVKDEDKRGEYEGRLAEVKAKIDESKRTVASSSTGLGRDIVATEELIEACQCVLNDEEVQIRLQTCPPGPYKYTNPDIELPGGSVDISTGQASALKTISLYEYQKGVFFGEEKVEVAPDSRYAFMIIYKTVFLHNTVWRAVSNHNTFGKFKEIYYNAGSCSQNYRNSKRVAIYDSGRNKAEILEDVIKSGNDDSYYYKNARV